MWEGPRSGEIICKSSEKREVIEIACASESEVGQSGFIGAGSTKRGIYVRTLKVCLCLCCNLYPDFRLDLMALNMWSQFP